MDTLSTAGQTAKIWTLAKSIRVAMLVTGHGDAVAARPMYCIISEGEGSVWFITARDSGKVQEAPAGSSALLTFSNGMDGDHVVMSGRIAAVDDREKLKALWSAGATVYFPKGPEDATATLLKFTPGAAEYWTGGSGIVAFALHFAEAKLTGERPRTGEHGKTAL